MTAVSKFITIIRPEFMGFCQDACRAATLNHLLYRIASKCKDQPKEKIQAGEILWYARNELITEEMSNAWGVCKVRKEVNELVRMGLFGRTSNPEWGADRTKHFFFGIEQCAIFLKFCEEQNICFVHFDLPDVVKHLIYSSNANDKSIKCSCKCVDLEEANDTSITCIQSIHQMETIDLSFAFDKSIEAITKDSIKDSIKENTKKDISAAADSAPAFSSQKDQLADASKEIASPPTAIGEPAPEMKWGTRKCLQWFDFWRGGTLIGKFKLMQASTCAKGLAEQFTEEQVIQARMLMMDDPFWIAQGSVDVCHVANNIHKYLKKTQQAGKPKGPMAELVEYEGKMMTRDKAMAEGYSDFDRYIGNGKAERQAMIDRVQADPALSALLAEIKAG